MTIITNKNLITVHNSQFREFGLTPSQHWYIGDKKVYIMEGDQPLKGFVKSKLRFATINDNGTITTILTPFN